MSTIEIIVIIVILACVVALVVALIFNKSFRDDVIGRDMNTNGENNGAEKFTFFGILTTSGSIIVVLVLSLAGMVFFILQNIQNQKYNEFRFQPEDPPKWYAINMSGEPIDAKLLVSDTLIQLGLSIDNIESKNLFKNNDFVVKVESNELLVYKGLYIWGKIDKYQSKGIYSHFNTLYDNELPRDYFKFKQFEKKEFWSEPETFFNAFRIEVTGEPGRTQYTIYDIDNNEPVYDSRGDQIVFNAKTNETIERKLHLFKKEDSYYLFRITSADPNGQKGTKKYVNFMGIKIELKL